MSAGIFSTVSDPSDLMNISDASIPYQFGRIFRAQGWGAARLERNRLKLMKVVDGEVQKLLAEGERVEFVSWGVEYSLLEHYFMGVWAQLLNRRALVFTDRRILLLQINSRRKPLDLKSQVQYTAIEKFARGRMGYLALVLRDRKKLVVTGIPRKDRKAIKELIAEKLEAARRSAPSSSGRENLCPHCGHLVQGFPEGCGQCQKSFKSGAKAGWLSLILPGLGDIYLGHRLLGTLEILGALGAWGVLVMPVAISAASGDGFSIGVTAVLAVMVFVFVHGTDAWITRRVGFKGIYPAN